MTERHTDRDLLEKAAKAAGFKGEWDAEWIRMANGRMFWCPLDDDGQALRLAVKLNLQVTPGTYRENEASAFYAGKGEANERVHYQQDLYAATRRAIVRAAAILDDIAAKDREIEGLRVDAERYRLLRMMDWFEGPLCVVRDPKRAMTRGTALGVDCPSRERLDAALDDVRAALAAAPGGEGAKT